MEIKTWYHVYNATLDNFRYIAIKLHDKPHFNTFNFDKFKLCLRTFFVRAVFFSVDNFNYCEFD